MDDQKIELDKAQPCDLATIEKFYENNLSSIVKCNSPTLSERTCSSSSSNIKVNDIRGYSSESTTASNSDTEELELEAIPNKEQFLKNQNDFQNSSQSVSNLRSHDGNLVVVNHGDNSLAQASGPRIETVAIQNSSDIQFGNKTFYNGPVTIKQFLLDDKNNKWISRTNDDIVQIESGTVNRSFDGKRHISYLKLK